MKIYLHRVGWNNRVEKRVAYMPVEFLRSLTKTLNDFLYEK